ncbi:tRNA (adenosine(37)-N6)-dimethylallyltransferase MiaA [Curvibacter sp. CHRR-16]|uniref:tRNA (adenosine(37)-N6)-dimethylallyltransferase MiaA n=1 Tax=Curvibacter sp. CHRR-16 TaxID=2835872 RepID=UPI001BDAC6C0|nr:tRNA (adenosine(37)-N6)-dimethylallyltransferase MiaA [Curvibacter sp. CHRR-16]MBT0569059.1 tRNA (adenosine(37)-N6)-dimethylallyltransferase MiaA [Curvibacter sp. CHRR-16]
MSLPLCIALAGPTAAGKTAAALALAERLNGEIISVDSALVYRSMDIGTAKPTPAELAQVPHHLINIRDPLQAYSAAEFVRDAQACIADIHARGKLPLLVGGTMLYFKALLHGMDDMPSANPAIRAELDEQAARIGWPAMHAELALIDPSTAQRLAPNDSQRIQRALEVYRISGKPLSAFHQSSDAFDGQGAIKKIAPIAHAASSAALFSLEPHDRSWLHQRIAQRFQAMLADGFLDEVQALRQRGDLHLDLPSMRCVGYRQAWEALDGLYPLAELPERGIAATRQLAKRQITWLRSMPERQAIACDAPDALEQLLRQVEAVVQSTKPT